MRVGGGFWISERRKGAGRGGAGRNFGPICCPDHDDEV